MQDALDNNNISGVQLLSQAHNAQVTICNHMPSRLQFTLFCLQMWSYGAKLPFRRQRWYKVFYANSVKHPSGATNYSIFFSIKAPNYTQRILKNLFQATLMDHNSTYLGHSHFAAQTPNTKVYAFLENKFRNRPRRWGRANRATGQLPKNVGLQNCTNLGH